MKNLIYLLFCFSTFGFSQIAGNEQIQGLIDNKKLSEAESLAKTRVASSGNDYDAIEKLGDIAGHRKQWDEAIKYYKQLVDEVPQNANYHYKYGGALGMKALTSSKLKALGLVGDIKKSFLSAASLDANHIDARWALVELYMQLPGIIGGSKKKSLKYADELENLSKVDGYLAKGYIYEYDKEPELAEKYYKLAVAEGKSVNCYTKLSELYTNITKEPIKAIETIEEAQKLHQRNTLHYQIGKVCAIYNIELDKGERCLQTFIENHTVKDGVPIEWAYYRLAQIYRYKGDKDNASDWIEKALAKRSNFKQALEEKALIRAL
ncbi:tetratricopeptide repeat protein [Sungkyunkwania multivorans]|uniref:Tetratricopeptide repeat protein n=1 Tax=Sungkyunkwania multivorans TaxID=1173618 RepID=A0ABW3CW40_9FLAO